jgi:hypothetical protein
MPSVRRLGAPDTGSSSNKEEMEARALEELARRKDDNASQRGIPARRLITEWLQQIR